MEISHLLSTYNVPGALCVLSAFNPLELYGSMFYHHVQEVRKLGITSVDGVQRGPRAV